MTSLFTLVLSAPTELRAVSLQLDLLRGSGRGRGPERDGDGGGNWEERESALEALWGVGCSWGSQEIRTTTNGPFHPQLPGAGRGPLPTPPPGAFAEMVMSQPRRVWPKPALCSSPVTSEDGGCGRAALWVGEPGGSEAGRLGGWASMGRVCPWGLSIHRMLGFQPLRNLPGAGRGTRACALGVSMPPEHGSSLRSAHAGFHPFAVCSDESTCRISVFSFN